MISTRQKWKSKADLLYIVKNNPGSVDIIGWREGDEGYEGAYSGLVSDMPYGISVYVKHKGRDYRFKKETNGRYKVL